MEDEEEEEEDKEEEEEEEEEEDHVTSCSTGVITLQRLVYLQVATANLLHMRGMRKCRNSRKRGGGGRERERAGIRNN